MMALQQQQQAQAQQQQMMQQQAQMQSAPQYYQQQPPNPNMPPSAYQQAQQGGYQHQQQQQQNQAPLELTPPPADQIPTNCLWVGYPAHSLGEEDMKPIFAQFGPIDSVKNLPQKNCMFVYMSDKIDAWKCVNTLAQRPVLVRGMSFKVGWGRDSGGGYSQGGRQDHSNIQLSAPTSSLWIGNVNMDMTENDLRDVFAQFGRIESVRLIMPRKCAFITFSSVDEATRAIEARQGYNLKGSHIKLNYGHGSQNNNNNNNRDGGSSYHRPDPMAEARLAPVAEVPPPSDPEAKHLIDELAGFVQRLGLAFEEKVKDMQKGNPRFEFLFGSSGAEYFQWKKYDLNEKEHMATSHLAPWQKASAQRSTGPARSVPDPNAVALSTLEQSELSTLIQTLQPTQDSIKAAKDWIMARAKLCNDIVAALKSQLATLNGFEPRLHVMYLVNDVLLHSSKAPMDFFAPALQRSLFELCQLACDDRVASPEQKQKIIDLVGIWGAKNFYPKDFLDDIKQKLESNSATKKLKTDPFGYN
jgi:hypothetical protein